jgi:hypothetical protein
MGHWHTLLLLSREPGSTMTTEFPGEWGEVDPLYPFQKARWQNRDSGNYLIVEGKTEPWHDEDENPDWSLVLVGEEAADDREPIRTVVEESKQPNDVMQRAFEWMQMHPNGTD